MHNHRFYVTILTNFSSCNDKHGVTILPSTYSDTAEIGLLQVPEDHIQKCTVVVGEIV